MIADFLTRSTQARQQLGACRKGGRHLHALRCFGSNDFRGPACTPGAYFIAFCAMTSGADCIEAETRSLVA